MQRKLLNKYVVAGITHEGLVRKQNEDNILIDEDLGLLLVADGMGGHQAGEVASAEAIKEIHSALQSREFDMSFRSWLAELHKSFATSSLNIDEKKNALEKVLHETNNHLYQLNKERNALNGSGMGTTIAGCWLLSDDVMLVFHIGDSRIYRIREGKLQALSRDHSMLQLWLDGGREGERPSSNVIVKALGPFAYVEPEINITAIEDADSFLICSDGLTDMLDDAEIEQVQQRLKGQLPDIYCRQLLAAALEKGGNDNVSIIWVAPG